MVSSREIAAALGLDHIGPEVPVSRASSLASSTLGSLVFVTEQYETSVPPLGSEVAMIARRPLPPYTTTTLVSENPRRDFGRAVRQFFAPASDEYEPWVHPTAILEHVHLGERVRIGAHTVIGGIGFGIEEGERLPHIGRVVIGDDVQIGALCSIARGTLDDTVIEDGVRIDDHVFIAHNCRVRFGATIIAGAELSGSVDIGPGAIISPQACVIDHVTIGAGAHVGIGAVVIEDVPDGAVVVGNPARRIR